MNPIRKTRSALVALALTLALATPSLAATSAQINETLQIDSTLALTVGVTSIPYGTVLGGAKPSSPNFAVSATTNQANGFEISVAFSALTAGAQSIPATARRIACYDTDGSSTLGRSFPTYACETSAAQFDTTENVGNSWRNVANMNSNPLLRTTAAGSESITAKLSVVVPAAQRAGSYTGTVDFVAVDRP